MFTRGAKRTLTGIYLEFSAETSQELEIIIPETIFGSNGPNLTALKPRHPSPCNRFSTSHTVQGDGPHPTLRGNPR